MSVRWDFVDQDPPPASNTIFVCSCPEVLSIRSEGKLTRLSLPSIYKPVCLRLNPDLHRYTRSGRSPPASRLPPSNLARLLPRKKERKKERNSACLISQTPLTMRGPLLVALAALLAAQTAAQISTPPSPLGPIPTNDPPLGPSNSASSRAPLPPPLLPSSAGDIKTSTSATPTPASSSASASPSSSALGAGLRENVSVGGLFGGFIAMVVGGGLI
jgi:hypothetical protein